MEPQSSRDATKDGTRNFCLAWMQNAGTEDFRCSSHHNIQAAPAGTENDEIGTGLRLVKQSSQQTTKGALQIDQTNADFNFPR